MPGIRTIISKFNLYEKLNSRKGLYQLLIRIYKKRLKQIYEIKSDNFKVGNDGEIYIDNVALGSYLFDKMHDTQYIDRLLKIKNDYKQSLLENLGNIKSHYELFKAYADYESLLFDQLIAVDRLPSNILLLRSGRYSYMQIEMYNLMHQGFQLARKEPNHKRTDWFMKWDDDWYAEHTLCRETINIRTLMKNSKKIMHDYALKNRPRYGSLDKTYEAMQMLHHEMMIYAADSQSNFDGFIKKNPHLKQYALLVSEGMEYNDELKSLRARTFYNFIKQCEKSNLLPMIELIKAIRIIKNQ